MVLQFSPLLQVDECELLGEQDDYMMCPSIKLVCSPHKLYEVMLSHLNCHHLIYICFFCPPGSWCWWRKRRNRYCKKCFSKVAGILTVLTLGIKLPWVVWSMRRDWKPKGTCWLCAENRLTVIDKILVKWNAHRSHVWKKGSRLTIWCKGQQQNSRSGKAEVCWWWFYAAAWRSRQKRLSGLSF